MLAGIIRMVREAGASKAPIQKLADKVAAWFVPIVLALAVITLSVWLIVTHEVYTAFNYAVSVIVISCPCALGLATPVAVMAASGRGASMGVLFKNAEAIQRAASVGTALLDKTATLTEGKPRIVFYESYVGEKAKEIAYAIESKLNHPLADCIANFCKEGSSEAEVEYLAGMGARGILSGKTYFLGNDRLMRHIGVTFDEETFGKLSKEGKTVLFLADSKKTLALFALADTLKEGSKEAVKELNALCGKVVMLTGDNRSCAEYIAEEAGISKSCVYAEVLPEDKLKSVQREIRENAGLPKRARRAVMMAAACMSLSSLFVVGNALRLTVFEKRKNKNNQSEEGMKLTLKIEGMMCGHCEKRVKDALEGVEGVLSAEANHKKKRAVVTLEKETDHALFIDAVKEAGYEVKGIE